MDLLPTRSAGSRTPLSRSVGLELPALITAAGESAARRFLEYFTAHIRNRNTRRAYAHAVVRFLEWCEEHGRSLEQLEPIVVAAYIEQLGGEASAPTVKQHLAAIRMLMDYLVVGQVLRFNPAAAVRGPKYVIKTGKTPVLFEEEARLLLESIAPTDILALRDRAILAVMTYSFARVGAVVKMAVKDYYVQGRRSWFRFHEKGGKFHQVPAHHKAEEYVDAYISAAGIGEDRHGPLFRSIRGRSRQLTDRPVSERDVLRMVKRRARAVGLPGEICCHTFRATGITNYLANGGSLEIAQAIAAHESPRTTKLYDRNQDELSLDEIERIRI
jgi:integrase/recombinase XerD